MRHAAIHIRAEMWDIRELVGIIGGREDRLTQVIPHFILININSGGELDIANMIAAEIHMHQAWDKIVGLSIPVVLYTLHQRTGTVANAYNSYTHFLTI